MRLDGVVIVGSLAKKCSCSFKLEARKIPVKWSRSKQVNYFLTVVLYCTKCSTGYFPALLKTTKDSNGNEWTVCEKPASTKKHNPQSVNNKSSKSIPLPNNNTTKYNRNTASTNSTKKKKQNKSVSLTDVEFGVDEPIFDETFKGRPVVTHGSPRSKQDSRAFTSAGTFRYGSRKKDDNWD